ncbi:hypothetical protein CH75_00480 [Dyella jiangningensis]|nr:hypothetical protein CH75_00480 [Dyella jiangningensis]
MRDKPTKRRARSSAVAHKVRSYNVAPVYGGALLWERTLCARNLRSGEQAAPRSRTRCPPTTSRQCMAELYCGSAPRARETYEAASTQLRGRAQGALPHRQVRLAVQLRPACIRSIEVALQCGQRLVGLHYRSIVLTEEVRIIHGLGARGNVRFQRFDARR